MKKFDKVLILNYGSQFIQLIARRIRELGIYSEILPWYANDNEILNFNPKAIILSGGSESVNNPNSPNISKIIYKLNVPILGICYGHQAVCKDFNGIIASCNKEYGESSITIIKEDMLFNDFWLYGNKYKVWMSHGDYVSKIPKDFIELARTDNIRNAIIKHKIKKIYGIQFHPEVSHTSNGIDILDSFLTKVSDCQRNWKIKSLVDDKINEIRNMVKNQRVVLGFSGGVDSTVTAMLLNKAIGKQFSCVFIDNGLLRKNELNEIKNNFKNNLNLNLKIIRAGKIFLQALKNINNPERKRKTIGKIFIDVFYKEIKRLKNISYLAQGTIYPDVIESFSTISKSKTMTIKSHHNVGGLPKNMHNIKLLEPLKFLFKDEVRQIGKQLGLSDDILNRHPYPGPGLSIRIIGNVTKTKCDILREADHIFINMLKNADVYNKIWQAYAALLPIKSTGVMGDSRTYNYICLLRAVVSKDGMTANFYNLEYNLLNKIAAEIINKVKGINRVVYDITSKPPATIELE